VSLNRSSSSSSVGRSNAGSEYTADGVVPAITHAENTLASDRDQSDTDAPGRLS